jgi:membrane protease YdiL (CAAX protease family)
MSPKLAAPAKAYWRDAKRHRYSLLFALPLLAFYEVLAAALSGGPRGDIRNGADVILKGPFLALFGRWGSAVFGALLIGGSLYLVARDLKRGGGLRPKIFLWMLAESALLAMAFGLVVATITAQLLSPLGGLSAPLAAAAQASGEANGEVWTGWWTRLMLSLGAGLYEELLFRVILVAALGQLARRAFRWRPLAAGAFATVLGALVFSGFHYVGPYGDPFRLDSFTFRFIAGVFFSAMYLARGFGITAWTHALYDVIVLVL